MNHEGRGCAYFPTAAWGAPANSDFSLLFVEPSVALGFLLDDTHSEVVLLLDHDIPDTDAAMGTKPPSAQGDVARMYRWSAAFLREEQRPSRCTPRHSIETSAAARERGRYSASHRGVVDGDGRWVKLGVQCLRSLSQRHDVAS